MDRFMLEHREKVTAIREQVATLQAQIKELKAEKRKLTAYKNRSHGIQEALQSVVEYVSEQQP
jgi:FtsZ-binding cell division protein ZapB